MTAKPDKWPTCFETNGDDSWLSSPPCQECLAEQYLSWAPSILTIDWKMAIMVPYQLHF